MRKDKTYNIGTLIDDLGKLAIITRQIKKGDLSSLPKAMLWSDSYELTYTNGDVCVYGVFTIHKLLANGQMKIISQEGIQSV